MATFYKEEASEVSWYLNVNAVFCILVTHAAAGPALQEIENNNYFSAGTYYLGEFSPSALQSESQNLILANVR